MINEDAPTVSNEVSRCRFLLLRDIQVPKGQVDVFVRQKKMIVLVDVGIRAEVIIRDK